MFKAVVISLLALLSFTSSAFADDKDSITVVRKGNRKYYYDTKERLLTRSRKETFFRKGSLAHYDTLGNVTAKGRIKLTERHGKWNELRDGKYVTVRYRYGVERSLLYTSEGKGMKLILGYGRGAHRGRSERYRVVLHPVAGCLVSRKIIIHCWLHNTFARGKLDWKYGNAWREEIRYDRW